MAQLLGPVLLSLTLLALTHCQSDIRRPPVIRDPKSTADKYYSPGDSFQINCTSDGQPPATYKWTKNGQDITSQYVTFDPTTGILKFTEFSTREEGIYMCIASNSFDNGQTKVTNWSPRLNVLQRRVDPFASTTPITISVTELDYALMRCNPKTVIGSDYVINWYLVSGSSIDLDNGRLFIDQKGNLHFTYVNPKDGGILLNCGISVQKDDKIVLGTANSLSVAPRSPVAIKPQLQYSNTGIKGRRLSSISLECMFSGFDPSTTAIPTTQWRDDSGQVITSSTKYILSHNGRVLTIVNIQEEDEREYTCSMKNSAGETSARVLLNVTSPPIFINGVPVDQTKPEGTDAQINCNARSASRETAPSPPVWYINGENNLSQKDPTKYLLSEGNKILTIKNLKKATDIQCVQCEVTNSEGTVVASACLNVILPITIVRKPAKLLQEINFGASVDLTVTATTDPSMTLNYKWEFNNKSYEGGDHPPNMYYNPNTMQAYINTSTLTEQQYLAIAGTYRRVISNLYEFKDVIIDVVLADRQASTGGLTVDPWIIGLIIALILLIIVIIIIIYVICRKKQEGDYNVDKKETGAGLDPEKELKDKEFNDFSRPVYDDYYNYPDSKPPGGDPEYDDAPIGGDDESLGEYGKEDITHFNEDGSFIGIYQSKQPTAPQPTESTI